jgi:mannose-6-phosphate isomerase-like protein (cupin superfamily)
MRRVVSGILEDGRAGVVRTDKLDFGLVWFGHFSDLNRIVEPSRDIVEPSRDVAFDLAGPDSGYTFHVMQLPPDEVTKPLYAAGSVPLHDELGFHQTDTVDILFVVDGEMTCEMDGGSVTLEAGDCFIQRGTRHAWHNRTGKPVTAVSVMLNDRGRTGRDDVSSASDGSQLA